MYIICFQRNAGIQRLSRHFHWFEFTNEKLPLHQEFVYGVAMFTAGQGFSWADVIRSAMFAKAIFPQSHGNNKPVSFIREINITLSLLHKW